MLELLPRLHIELQALDEDATKVRLEAARLQSKLAQLVDKAEKIRAVIAVYEQEASEPTQPQLFIPQSDVHEPLASAPSRKRLEYGSHGRSASKASLVRQAVADHLRTVGQVHRQEILNVLVEKGLMGYEKVPLASLAAYLSENKDIFEADGRGNFSLRIAASPEPQPAAKLVGSVEAADSGINPEPAFNPQIVNDEG